MADTRDLVKRSNIKSMNPYANCRVYGPYYRPDNRQHVVCIFLDGTRKTVSYPKFLVEQAVGRVLIGHEEVHHINGDFTDNRLENLEIVNKIEHAKKHIRRLIKQDFLCPVCGCEFWLDGAELSNVIANRKMGKSKTGPYCSKSCAGIGSSLRTEVKAEYVTLLSQRDNNNFSENGTKSVEPIIDGNAELS